MYVNDNNNIEENPQTGNNFIVYVVSLLILTFSTLSFNFFATLYKSSSIIKLSTKAETD